MKTEPDQKSFLLQVLLSAMIRLRVLPSTTARGFFLSNGRKSLHSYIYIQGDPREPDIF